MSSSGRGAAGACLLCSGLCIQENGPRGCVGFGRAEPLEPHIGHSPCLQPHTHTWACTRVFSAFFLQPSPCLYFSDRTFQGQSMTQEDTFRKQPPFLSQFVKCTVALNWA